MIKQCQTKQEDRKNFDSKIQDVKLAKGILLLCMACYLRHMIICLLEFSNFIMSSIYFAI